MAKRPEHYSRAGDLTPRQREVLRMIAAGHTNPEIANKLSISLDGAKFHVREIFARLGVDTREEAAAWWQAQQSPASKISTLSRAAVSLGWAKVAAGGAAVAAVAIGGAVLAGALFAGHDRDASDGMAACLPGTVNWTARTGSNADGSIALELSAQPITGEWPCRYRADYTLSALAGESYAEKQTIASDLRGDTTVDFADSQPRSVVSIKLGNACVDGPPIFVRAIAENEHESLERSFEVSRPADCDERVDGTVFSRGPVPAGTSLSALPADLDGYSNTLRALPGEDIATIARTASHLAGYDVNYPSVLPAWSEASYTVTASSVRFDASLTNGKGVRFSIIQASFGPPNTTKVLVATHDDGRKIWRNADGSVFIDSNPMWQGLPASGNLDEETVVDILLGLRPARSVPSSLDVATLPRCDDASVEWLGTFAESQGTIFTFSGRSNGAPGPCLFDAQVAVAAIIVEPGVAEQVVGSAQSATWDGNYRQVLTSQFEPIFRADLWNVCTPVDGVVFRAEVFVERTGARSTHETAATPPRCERTGEPPIFQGSSQQAFPPPTARVPGCDLDTVDWQGETSRDASGGIEFRIYAVAVGATEPCVYSADATLSAWFTGPNGLRADVPAAGNPAWNVQAVKELSGDYRLFVAGTLTNACGNFDYSTVSLTLRYDSPQDNIIERFNVDVPSCVSDSAPSNLALTTAPTGAPGDVTPSPGTGSVVPGSTTTTLCPGASCPGADAFLHNPSLALFMQEPVTQQFRCSAADIASESFCAGATINEERPGNYAIEGGQRLRISPEEMLLRSGATVGWPGASTILAVGDSGKGPIDVVFRRNDGVVSIALCVTGRFQGPCGWKTWDAVPVHGEQAETSFGSATYYNFQ